MVHFYILDIFLQLRCCFMFWSASVRLLWT